MTRGTVGHIAFIHVLGRHAGQGVEQRLVEEAVRTLRAGGVEGIVSEYVTFSTLDLRKPMTVSTSAGSSAS